MTYLLLFDNISFILYDYEIVTGKQVRLPRPSLEGSGAHEHIRNVNVYIIFRNGDHSDPDIQD